MNATELLKLADYYYRQTFDGPHLDENVASALRELAAIKQVAQGEPAAFIEQYSLNGETQQELVWDNGERDDRTYVPLYTNSLPQPEPSVPVSKLRELIRTWMGDRSGGLLLTDGLQSLIASAEALK